MTNQELTKRTELLKTIKALEEIKEDFTEGLNNLIEKDIEKSLTQRGDLIGLLVFKKIENCIYEKIVFEQTRLMNELNNLNKK